MPPEIIPTTIGLREGETKKYSLSLESGGPALEGVIACICSRRYSQVSFDVIWEDIKERNAASNSIVYIMSATVGAYQVAYVGKTLGRLSDRYPAGPKGGLAIVRDTYVAHGFERFECTLYNPSHPALVELWCYSVLTDRKINLANIMDPS
jgi:hypothetical protein